jgi:ABC-type Fe3+-hydroxamate transport system substrate-binding protein
MKESKNDKFKRLATKRVNTLLKTIRLVSNLSNKSNYEFSEDEANKIIRAISNSFDELKSKFKSKKDDFKI